VPTPDLTTVWNPFRRKPRTPQQVTAGRFEIEREGEVAYLAYTLSGNILELSHTEIPEKLQHQGLASALAETGLRYARQHNLKVDIVCPSVQQFVAKHPEYSDLVLR
jgi:hypothetical protein